MQTGINWPVCDRMWICKALSLPSTLRQRRQRCLKMADESSLPVSATLSGCRITVTFGGLPTASQPILDMITSIQHLLSSSWICISIYVVELIAYVNDYPWVIFAASNGIFRVWQYYLWFSYSSPHLLEYKDIYPFLSMYDLFIFAEVLCLSIFTVYYVHMEMMCTS